MSKFTGRFVPLQAGGPAENMAVDQALMESVAQGGGPVLRCYTWAQPTLSLGYFQKAADRRSHPESAKASCVRRSTGGGAIVHDRELTYSVVVPIDRSSPGPELDLYRQVHAVLVGVLGQFGVLVRPFRITGPASAPADTTPFLCFQRRSEEDLMLHGYKVVGSAQRKNRHCMLQHGSVLLASSPLAPQLPGVAELTSRSIPIETLARRFRDILGTRLGIHWAERPLDDRESERVSAISRGRFASRRWLKRR